MIISDVCSKDLVVMDSCSNISDVAIMMKRYDVGFILINEGKRIIGVITDRDIVIRALSNCSLPDDSVEKYITRSVFSISDNKNTSDALKIMGDKRIKRLVVTNKKKVVGVISLCDIINNVDCNDLQSSCGNIFKINKNTDHFLVEIDEFYL